MIDKIFNENCFTTLEHFDHDVNVIMTSPPYNMTKRKGGYADSGRYDVYHDWLTVEEYLAFTSKLFNALDRALKQNGVVLYNFSYSIENPSLPYKLVTTIENETPFALADTIVWKKSSGLPFPANKRRLARLWEFVFVFCRKDELDTFEVHKGVSSVSQKTGQTYYRNHYNFIEAKNNDGVCPYNQATYSSELCEKLLSLYCAPNGVVYDPFMGSGTTAVACKKLGLHYIGSEISKNQCEWAKERLRQTV